jgi:hypothetical protein
MRSFIISAIVSLSLCACDNPDQTANGLFVEASQAATQAIAETDIVKKHDLLSAADTAASRITNDYAGSSAAVRVAANEKLGPLTLPEIKAALADIKADPSLCMRFVTRECMIPTIKAAVQYISTIDRNTRPDATKTRLAVTGWPYLIATDPSAAETAIPADRRLELSTILAEGGFGPFGGTIPLITLSLQAQGQEAAAQFVKALAADPSYKTALLKNAAKIADAVFTTPTPERAANARAIINSIASPLPPDVAEALDNKLCALGYNDTQHATVAATCTPEQILKSNSSFSGLPAELYDRLYALAKSPEDKRKVASSAMSTRDTDQRMAWYEAAGYLERIDLLIPLYVEATRKGHPVRPALMTHIEQAKEYDPNSPLTKANISNRTIVLMHAQGTLVDQLPAIYHHLQAQQAYSYPLEEAINTLLFLQPLTPGMDLAKLSAVAGTAVRPWTDTNASNRKIIMQRIHAIAAEQTKDAKPILDLFHGGRPYHALLSAEELLAFKNNGHNAIYEAAVAESKPITENGSILFSLEQRKLDDAVTAKDLPSVIAILDGQPKMVRYYMIRNILTNDHFGSGLDVTPHMRAAVIERYPYDAVANELGWNTDLGVPIGTKKKIIFENFQALKEFKVNPQRWLVSTFANLTHEERLKTLSMLHDGNEQNSGWPAFAIAIAMSKQ